MEQNYLNIISGPSGSGKSSIIQYIKENYSPFYYSLSWTTRDMRPGEKEGVNYHFTDKVEFNKLKAENGFLETAEVFGMNSYGTPIKPVLENLNKKIPVLIEVDVEGARQIKDWLKQNPDKIPPKCLDANFIFILPPSDQVLVDRLKSRGTESKESLKKRLQTAQEELDAQNIYTHKIINLDLAHAADQVANIMGLKKDTGR